ncbi:MAG: T9SS type A sorting domain-containing protein [Flavobacteriales bacterium]|nr:MAG: T9SS type A sorting domain-containing protein [Flavobacteriales bacterium]
MDGETIPAHELQFAGGGVVRASNVLFSNNVRNVVMGPYENFQPGDNSNVRPNRSWFHRCRFETSATLTDNQRYPIEHAYLLGVRGVNFLGNTMINYGPFPAQVDGEMVTSDRFAGTGITAINTTLRVQGHCDVLVPVGTPCPPADFQRGRFEGLAQAMYVSSFDPGRTFIVDECDFHLCYNGVRMEGIQDAAITRSTFLVGEPQQGDWENVPYGVYSDQCTGYEIEENSFTATNTATKPMVGLVIKDSGPYSNRFYNNSFDGFDVDNSTGSIIEGVNADANTNYLEGLEVKCNDYGQVVKNSFDVGLTGPDVSVKNAQGEPMVLQTDYDKPAGNRFSVAHDGTFDTEEDWFVEDVSNFVEYFQHIPTPGDRTEPVYHDSGNLTPNSSPFTWPGKALACPSDLSHGDDPEEKRLASLAADGEKQDAEDAYEAAKDDGDTYSLLAYVSDGSKSSTQVRNALQSVAPKVSEEVWTAAFARTPAMSQLHMAQALLSNSPLQGEVLKLMSNSGLGAYYQQLVWNAQDGTANILTLLESAIAYAASTKAQALTDLGRLSWLADTDLSASLVALKSWHEGLSAENNAAAIGGVLAAKADEAALFTLAQTTELSTPTPEVYGVLKRYAIGLDDAEWTVPTAADIAWLQSTAAQRALIGSAHAQAWLLALGHQDLSEIIILPPLNRAPRIENNTTHGWSSSDEIAVNAYPNPANSGTVLDLRLPNTNDAGRLRVVDVSGRVMHETILGPDQQLVDLTTSSWTSGLYFAEVWMGNEQVAALKLGVQH